MHCRTNNAKKIAVNFVKIWHILLDFSTNKAAKYFWKILNKKIINAMRVLIITMPFEKRSNKANAKKFKTSLVLAFRATGGSTKRGAPGGLGV